MLEAADVYRLLNPSGRRVDIFAVTQHFTGDFKDHPDSDFAGRAGGTPCQLGSCTGLYAARLDAALAPHSASKYLPPSPFFQG